MVIEKKRPFERTRRFFAGIGKRNLIIAAAVILIGAAVAVNWAVFADKGNPGYPNYDVSSGMTNNNGGSTAASADEFFSATQVSRTKARDEALLVLKSVVEDDKADEASKTAAYDNITKLAKQMDDEANIESLITAKGFSKCVAVISDSGANIVVKSDEALTAAQLSQINEIVYTQAGITPDKITVIKK